MLRSLVQSRARSGSAVLATATCSTRRQLHGSATRRALTKFTFPAMSPTMTEGGISAWKKAEGESFAPGDVLLEMETDKASMDVEAQDEGILVKILIGDGSKAVKVGSVAAILGEEGDDMSAEAVDKLLADEGGAAPTQESEGTPDVKQSAPEKPQEKEDSKVAQPEEKEQQQKQASSSGASSSSSSSSSAGLQPSGDRTTILASPIAKRIALEQGIPLSKIKGTGPNGRIVKADVDNYKPAAAAPSTPSPSASKSSSSSAPASSSSSSTAPASSGAAAAKYTDTPVSNMRRTIAARLTDSKTSTPHYYVTAEINMDRVNKLRSLFNSAAKEAELAGGNGNKDGVKSGLKLSVNDFILKASALALAEVPEVNSGWHGDFIRQYHTADISVAVATPNGLITPIVTNVGAKGLATISSETKALASRARDGKLKPEEYQGGSFTISNLGMMGVESFTAIINPPQSAILAIGATENKLVLDSESEKGFKEVAVMKVTISCDHRVVDGAVGARWLKAFKGYLENPLSFLL